MNPMGIFGGTFDPIHYAHLRTAFELQQALRLKEIRFMPAGNPPHRDQPIAAAKLRLEMVQLATAGQPGFLVDDREVRKEGPSYSVETARASCGMITPAEPVHDRGGGRVPEPAQVA